jgi:hypothetical protein
MLVVNILTEAYPRLDRLGQRSEMLQRRLAAHEQVHSVVAIAGASPLAPPRLDRLLKASLRRAIDEIEHRCRAAKQRRAAHLVGRCAQHVFVAAGKRDRRQAVNMRINAAGDGDLARRVDHPLRRPGGPQGTRRADRNDLRASNPDVDGSGSTRHDRDTTGNNQIEHGVPSYLDASSTTHDADMAHREPLDGGLVA